jgi:hypothetical protein
MIEPVGDAMMNPLSLKDDPYALIAAQPLTEAAFLESPPLSRGRAFFSYLDRKRPGREISPLLGLLKRIMVRREGNVKPAKRVEA